MSYVTWPDVVSKEYLEEQLSKIGSDAPVYLHTIAPPSGQSNITVNAGDTYTSDLIDGYVNTFDATKQVCVKLDANYLITGSGGDELRLQILNSNDGLIADRFQRWNDAAGGGTRSGPIFPCMFVFGAGVVSSGFKFKITNNSNDTLTIANIADVVSIKVSQSSA